MTKERVVAIVSIDTIIPFEQKIFLKRISQTKSKKELKQANVFAFCLSKFMKNEIQFSLMVRKTDRKGMRSRSFIDNFMGFIRFFVEIVNKCYVKCAARIGNHNTHPISISFHAMKNRVPSVKLIVAKGTVRLGRGRNRPSCVMLFTQLHPAMRSFH